VGVDIQRVRKKTKQVVRPMERITEDEGGFSTSGRLRTTNQNKREEGKERMRG